jgi:pimeloyl-ACP methyl ester carboxylesterase
MSHVTSPDGTVIAFECHGSGPAVVLVGGGLVDRSENVPLALELANDFTVYNYDRRGRGASGDEAPYAVEREIEDLETLVHQAGGSVHLFGASSGGAIVLLAAAAGVAGAKLAVYEVPYSLGDTSSQHWRDYVEQLESLLAEDRHGDAIALFMRLAGASDSDIAGARSSPYWAGLEGLAHTLAYDAACLGDGQPPADRLATISQHTLVATGAAEDPHMSSLPSSFFDQAADAIAESLPHSERLSIEGQSHVADPKVLGPVLKQFFGT